jgi:DNA-binding NarL/FixJ family response regulator
LIRVAIVAGTAAVRAGLQALLSADPQIGVIGQATSLPDLSRGEPDPDVVVVMEAGDRFHAFGATLGGENGGQFSPPAGLLLLTDRPERLQIEGQVPPRAWGLLHPDATQEELTAAVHALYQGLSVGDPDLLNGLMNRARNIEPDGDSIRLLTGREVEVLQLLSQGLANKQIAEILQISPHTVKFHIGAIYAKIGATNRAEAVRLGLQHGLLTL